MAKFDFERWFGVVDEDNHADDSYGGDEEYQYCFMCSNLMVPIAHGKYKCPVCGEVEDAD